MQNNAQRQTPVADAPGSPTRRSFLGATAIGATTFSTLTAAQARRVIGANERVILALIGAGGRGNSLARRFAARKDAEFAYVCDLHPTRRANGIKNITAAGRRQPRGVAEIARVLDSKDVHAVIVATPDHWHALATIRACQAGKDVYVEKPPSHNLWEGRKMVEAARRYRRIVQVGTQNRSAPYNLRAREYIQKGQLGDIHLCKVFNLKSGGAFRLGPNGKVPNGFNWNTWLGPAAQRPYNERLFRGGWHKYWAYCGGDLGDDGIHQIDLALMLLGDPALPTVVHGSGNRLRHRDDREVPDTQAAYFEYPNLMLSIEMTNWPPYMDKIAQDIRNSDRFPHWPTCATRIELYGTRGVMYMGRHGGGWQVFTNAKQQSRPGPVAAHGFGRPGDQPHQDNFIACIRSRQRPTADVEIGHKSMTLVHLSNIAHRAGNEKLQFDSKRESFVGNREADRLLRRDYRKGFEVPERV